MCGWVYCGCAGVLIIPIPFGSNDGRADIHISDRKHIHTHAQPTTHQKNDPQHTYSGTVIGLKCKDGLLLAVENLRLSKLLVPFSNRRTFPVGDHACIAVAGMYVDVFLYI